MTIFNFHSQDWQDATRTPRRTLRKSLRKSLNDLSVKSNIGSLEARCAMVEWLCRFEQFLGEYKAIDPAQRRQDFTRRRVDFIRQAGLEGQDAQDLLLFMNRLEARFARSPQADYKALFKQVSGVSKGTSLEEALNPAAVPDAVITLVPVSIEPQTPPPVVHSPVVRPAPVRREPVRDFDRARRGIPHSGPSSSSKSGAGIGQRLLSALSALLPRRLSFVRLATGATVAAGVWLGTLFSGQPDETFVLPPLPAESAAPAPVAVTAPPPAPPVEIIPVPALPVLDSLPSAPVVRDGFQITPEMIKETWNSISAGYPFRTLKVVKSAPAQFRPLIVIDLGHCEKFPTPQKRASPCMPGAAGGTLSEIQLVDRIGDDLAQKLKAQGHLVSFTRNPGEVLPIFSYTEDSRKPYLTSRSYYAQRLAELAGASHVVFISLHANSNANSKACGAEFYVHAPEEHDYSRDRKNFSNMSSVALGAHLMAEYPQTCKPSQLIGADKAVLAVFDEAARRHYNTAIHSAAVLAELGFLSNASDLKFLKAAYAEPEIISGPLMKGIQNFIDAEKAKFMPKPGSKPSEEHFMAERQAPAQLAANLK